MHLRTGVFLDSLVVTELTSWISHELKCCGNFSLLPNSRPLTHKMRELRLLATNNSYDVILVSEAWLADHGPISSFSLTGCNSHQTNRLNRKEGGCPAYVKQVHTAFLPSIWLILPPTPFVFTLKCLSPQST